MDYGNISVKSIYNCYIFSRCLKPTVIQFISAGIIKSITKTCPCNIQISFGCKNGNFHWTNFDIFLILAQNIDCGYTLEPPRQKVYPCIPQFYYIKVGYKGVFISRTCFPDETRSSFLIHNKQKFNS